MTLDSVDSIATESSTPSKLVGRDEVLQEIRSLLQEGESIAIIGGFGSGKTSILLHIANDPELRSLGMVIVLVPLLDVQTSLEFLRNIVKRLNVQLSNRYDFGPLEKFEDFETAIEILRADGYRPIVCLDEFELIANQPWFDEQLSAFIRELALRQMVQFVVRLCPKTSSYIDN